MRFPCFQSHSPESERTRAPYGWPMKLAWFTGLCLSPLFSNALHAADPPGWKLVWSDEFNGKTIDSSKWSPCERGKSDWDDTMSREPKCYKIGGGTLRLIGLVNPDLTKDPSPFITGGVTSKGKYHIQHGNVLIRARFKSAKGAWPALWLLGTNGRWPHNGEIDLMEHLNFDDKVYQTIHSFYANEVDKTQKNPPKGTTAPIRRDAFNTYGAEWDENRIVFLVNDKATLTYPRVPEKGPEQWPFDQPFHLILSMQIEGKWVGRADPKDYPADLEIDWVRVYQKAQ